MSKLIVNMALSGLSYGIYSNMIYFLLLYLDPVNYAGDFALYYGVFQITISLALPFAGVLTDKVGRKPMLILGATTTALGTFILPLARTWWDLLYASAAQAVGFAFIGPAQNCVVADISKGYRREKAYSITMSFSMAFGVIGTVALIVYTALYQSLLPVDVSYQLPLLVAALLSLMAAIPMFLIRIPKRPQEDKSCNSKSGIAVSTVAPLTGEKQKQSYELPKSIWKNGVIMKVIAFQAIIGFGAGFLVPLFNYYWYNVFVGLQQYVIYTISLLGELGTAVGGLASPWLAKRATRLGGRIGTTVTCQFLSIACAVYLATVPYYSVLLPAVIAFVVRMALMNMVNPLMQAMTMDHTPEEKRGRVNSLTSFAFNVPNGISPRLSTELIRSVPSPPGSAYGYTYSAAVLVTTYIFATTLLYTTKKKDKLLVKQTRQVNE